MEEEHADARLPLLHALHELLDVSQGLGLHAPSPAERTAVRSKLRGLRLALEHAEARAAGPLVARLHEQADALHLLLDDDHDPERWRDTRAALLEHYQDLEGTLRDHHGDDVGAQRRVKPHNLRRSLFHAGSGLAWAMAYHLLERWQMLLALAFFLVIFVIDDVMRRWFPDRRGRFAVTVFRLLSRPSESAKIASSTWYTVGMILGVLTLPPHAFLTGLLVLALADPCAALVGRRFGRRRLYRDKSVIGTSTFFVVAMAVALVVNQGWVPELGVGGWLGSAALIALAGTVAELLGDHVQDNMSILLAAGATTALLS